MLFFAYQITLTACMSPIQISLSTALIQQNKSHHAVITLKKAAKDQNTTFEKNR